MNLPQKISTFPAKPGVYLFKNAKGEILYVGKAKSLCARVASYYRSSASREPHKVDFLLRRASDIDFIVTDTEKEALLLENTFIKKHRPRYNIQLKDDKTYVSVRVGLKHPFPGISVLRRVLKDDAVYFGPYSSAVSARETVDNIIKAFRIRSCSDREFSNRIRPCLEFDLGRCTAPCVGRISEKDYRVQVDSAVMFLKGRARELIKKLDAKMNKASNSMHYEEAARIRNSIARIKATLAKQKMVVHGGGSADYIGVARDKGRVAVCILMVRGGVLLDKRMHAVNLAEVKEDLVLEAFILEHYSSKSEIPRAIFVSHRLDAISDICSILSERRGGKTQLITPRRGRQMGMVNLAKKNARELLLAKYSRASSIDGTLLGLQRKLRLRTPPEVIECLDISNLMGREAYGSLVTFIHGEPEKSRYRLYSIRTFTTPDDYGMMREVLNRRFRNPPIPPLKKGGKGGFSTTTPPPEPDLFLIDGGKGQLNVAGRVLKEIGLEKLPVASIAKTPDGPHDRIFLPGRKNPVPFKRGSKEILLLERIRDEAHRFGITQHRRKRIRDFLT